MPATRPVIVACSPPSGSVFPIGTNRVTCVATDAGGNTNSCSFNITVQAAVPPALNIVRQGTNLVLSWPITCTNYVLQEATNLSPPQAWMSSLATVTSSGGQHIAVISLSASQLFFRLVTSPLAPPRGLELLLADHVILARWEAVSNATSYKLYFSTNANVSRTNFTGMATISLGTNHAVTGLSNGLRYYFVVTARNSAGESVESRSASAVFGVTREVRGSIFAMLQTSSGPEQVFLPGVSVYLVNMANGQQTARFLTDDDGAFTIPQQPAGSNRLCWEAAGYVPGTGRNQSSFQIARFICSRRR